MVNGCMRNVSRSYDQLYRQMTIIGVSSGVRQFDNILHFQNLPRIPLAGGIDHRPSHFLKCAKGRRTNRRADGIDPGEKQAPEPYLPGNVDASGCVAGAEVGAVAAAGLDASSTALAAKARISAAGRTIVLMFKIPRSAD